MALTYKKSSSTDDALMADINTTPLVDVMLVLLIIFLITIPAVTTAVNVQLPKETISKSEPTRQTVILTIDAAGLSYWKDEKLNSELDLAQRLSAVSAMPVKPEVHIRGDAQANFDRIGKTVHALQQAGVTRIGFITQPVQP